MPACCSICQLSMQSTHKPGDLFRAFQGGDKKKVNSIKKLMKTSAKKKPAVATKGKSKRVPTKIALVV